jgi:ABC-2 type transport system permease protein
MPIQQLVFFSLLGLYMGGRSRVEYLVIGNVILLAGFGSIWAVFTVGEERTQGTLTLLLASPANRLLNFLQRGVFHVGDSLLTVTVALAAAILFFHVDLGHADGVGLVASILVAVFCSIGLGLLLGSLALVLVDAYFIANVVYLALFVIAGVNFPPSVLPSWLRPLSLVVPFTRSAAAARSAAHGVPLIALAPSLLTEVGLGIVYIFLGYAFLGWLESIALRRGSLELT